MLRSPTSIIPLMQRVYGEGSHYALFTATTRADAESQLGSHDQAIAELQTVREKQEDTLGAEHSNTLRTASTLGAALVRAGRQMEGAELLEATKRQQARILGVEHFETKATARRLTELRSPP
eukprot:m.95617 g.95617  ORF g.95617 m.95617 type:complete len:122 (+) comp12333_c0_seq2:1028-1393(+)